MESSPTHAPLPVVRLASPPHQRVARTGARHGRARAGPPAVAVAVGPPGVAGIESLLPLSPGPVSDASLPSLSAPLSLSPSVRPPHLLAAAAAAAPLPGEPGGRWRQAAKMATL
ncbi:hypothetical protein ZWY2020_004807 [Hordeum vulgare]|nr:hypothetical protein ZWY2020_004807 [Hordeum vulgare]